MQERDLRNLIEERARRPPGAARLHPQLVGLGLTAPMATQLLMHAGVAHAQAGHSPYKPTKRGGGGALKLLWWQGADAAEPAFRDRHQGPGRLAHLLRAARRLGRRRQPGPGARGRDPDARERRPVAPTARSVTWKLKRDVQWHDGKPFTADDVRVQLGVRDRPGDRRGHRSAPTRTSRSRRSTRTRCASTFQKPTPFWADAFVGTRGMIIPKHLFDAYTRRQVARGAGQPEAGRHRPVQVRRLQAGRHGARRAQPELPHAQPAALRHDRDEGRRRRGLGGARGAADRRIRLRLEPAGRGRDPASAWKRAARAAPTIVAGGDIEFIQLNFSRPVDRGRRRARERQDASTRFSATRRCARR